MKSVTIQLPGEIGAQLRALTAAVTKPASDLIAEMVAAHAERINVQLPIWGVTIANRAEGIVVTMDGRSLQPMTPEQVQSLIGTLDNVMTGETSAELNLDLPDAVTVRRVGTGFAFMIGADYRRVFAKSVLRALQSQLRLAVRRSNNG